MLHRILRTNKEIKESSRYLHLRKFKKISSKENREIARKRGKIKNCLNLLTRYCHGNDLQKVNNNTNMIARMLLILLENVVNISHSEKKNTLDTFVQYNYVLYRNSREPPEYN